jgi:ribonuclease P protein component
MVGQISFRLEKSEIIRGYRSFELILNDSKIFRTNLLTGFLKANKISLLTKRSPHRNVKVGFIISKKKFRKAFKRNKIRRLLKEAYRLNRRYYLEEIRNYSIQLIIGLNSSPEIMAVKEEVLFSFEKINIEMEKLLIKINEFLVPEGKEL